MISLTAAMLRSKVINISHPSFLIPHYIKLWIAARIRPM